MRKFEYTIQVNVVTVTEFDYDKKIVKFDIDDPVLERKLLVYFENTYMELCKDFPEYRDQMVGLMIVIDDLYGIIDQQCSRIYNKHMITYIDNPKMFHKYWKEIKN